MISLFPSFLLLLMGSTSLVDGRLTTTGASSFWHRQLQDFNEDLVPPKRACGEVIGYTSLEDIQAFASILIDGLLGTNNETAAFVDLAKQVLVGVAKYGIVAEVVCTSCDEILELYADADFIDGDFSEFCNAEVHGGNITTSSLLVHPVDAEQQPIIGKLKTYTQMHTFTGSKLGSPSEVFPDDLLATLADLPIEEVAGVIFAFYDTIAPIMAASSGAVAIAPDYIGLGQSYQENRLFFQLNSYKMAATTHWLKASKLIEENSEGCQVLDPATASAGGFSEGGGPSYAVAKALKTIGVEPKQVSMGAPLLNAPASLTWGYNELKTNPASLQVGLLPVLNAAFGDSFSSINPDLPNSDAGQDALTPEFQDNSTFLTDVNAWFQSEQNLTTLGQIIFTATDNNPTAVLNPNITKGMDTAIAEGSFEACDFAVEGETDLFCRSLSEQNLLAMVNEESSIRLDVCHSPDDDVVPEEINRPDYSNPNIFKFTLQIFEASGGHFESSLTCLIATIVPFTGGAVDVNSVEPLDDPSTCPRSEGTMSPTAATTAPSAMGSPAESPSAAPSAPSSESTPSPTAETTPAPSESQDSGATCLSVWILGLMSFSSTAFELLLF